jgi:hypothetical protein
MDGDPLARFCENAWHHVPEVQRDDEFTALEFQVILALCWGGLPRWRLKTEEIPQQLGIAEDLVMSALMSIYKKVGTGGSGLIEFAREALNNELRRRRS